jgi:hypothetical protein
MRNGIGFFCIVFCMIVTAACSSKKDKILPKEKMQAVMWDMMRADKFLSDYVLNRDTSKKKDSESVKLYQQVFAIHKINGEQFSKSLEYYKERPDELRQIMDSISRPATPPPAETVQPIPAVKEDTGKGQKQDTLPPRKIKKVL